MAECLSAVFRLLIGIFSRREINLSIFKLSLIYFSLEINIVRSFDGKFNYRYDPVQVLFTLTEHKDLD